MDTPAPGSPGGLRNAIAGSIMMCAMAMVMALTIGVLAGTWLAEYAGQSLYGKVVRFVNDVLLSAPSILIGLFVYTILVAPFHGFSGIAGSVALALLAVPVVTRTTEDVMNLQPSALREAGVALGSPLASTIRRILWRASGTGILTGGLLAFARISRRDRAPAVHRLEQPVLQLEPDQAHGQSAHRDFQLRAQRL